jgi:hypothetical protein
MAGLEVVEINRFIEVLGIEPRSLLFTALSMSICAALPTALRSSSLVVSGLNAGWGPGAARMKQYFRIRSDSKKAATITMNSENTSRERQP